MKKFIYAISSFAVIFAVGCSKDEVEKPAPEYDLVVNMEKPSFGDDTRAARTSWEDGDVVYVVFNEDAKDSKYLALTYNAGSWTSKWEGTTAEAVAAKGSGTLKAGYMNVPLNNTNYISFVLVIKTEDGFTVTVKITCKCFGCARPVITCGVSIAYLTCG